MRAAADLEDSSAKHVAMENRLYPMRELLADMLLQDDPAGALKEYETSMKNAPNRLRGFFGAARAATSSGDKERSGEYLRRLVQLTQGADSDRVEIREARSLASR